MSKSIRTMNGWCSTEGLIPPSFTSLFAQLQCPPPRSCSQSTKTKDLNIEELVMSGGSFHDIRPLSLETLRLSDAHTFTWAKGVLASSAPIVPGHLSFKWNSQSLQALISSTIRSENDTAKYFATAVLDPALTAAICLYVEHMGPMHSEDPDRDCSHPGSWEVADLALIGSCGRPDIGIVPCRDVAEKQRQATSEPALSGESKTWKACHSKGRVNGVFYASIEVFPLLSPWMECEPNKVIPMDPPGTSAFNRPRNNINKYPEDWQHKIQKFFFQVSC